MSSFPNMEITTQQTILPVYSTALSFRIRIYRNCVDLATTCPRRSLQTPSRLTSIATLA
jgi:hypothetical protein